MPCGGNVDRNIGGFVTCLVDVDVVTLSLSLSLSPSLPLAGIGMLGDVGVGAGLSGFVWGIFLYGDMYVR